VSGTGSQASRLARIAALGEPLRRDIYLFVASAPDAVSRDQAADRFGVSRAVAAFHLDKLADLGLLDVEFKRPPGRSGPGAGRPAKRYRASTKEVSFSVPPREYERAGHLLAEAVMVSRRDGTSVDQALNRDALTLGRSLARRAREEAGERTTRRDFVDAGCRVLRDFGYEPRKDTGGVILVNCPFHSLAQEYRELICGMNLAIMRGFAEELEGAGLQALLDPGPGRCCVRLTAQAAF
jgi:predicted ArsR family transcriptional regulator